MRIRTKISLWYAGLLTLIIVIFSVAVFGVIQATIISSIDGGLEQTATNLIRNIRVMPVGEFGTPQARVVFRTEDDFRVPGVSIQVWQTTSSSGDYSPVLIKSSYDLVGYDNALDASALGANAEQFSSITINTVPGRVSTRPFTTAGGQQIGVVQIAVSTLIVQQVSNGVLSIMLVASALAVVVAIGLGMWLSYRALTPIQEIASAAASIATSNDLTTRLPENGPDDEIGHLTRVFNHMMQRLEHIFGVQQRFVADLSHELRTPLTAIQGNLDMIKRYGMDEVSLEAIQLETTRMTRMVNEVLMLARADYGDINIDMDVLDLGVLTIEVFSSAPALARKRDLKFDLGKHETVLIKGNYERLMQVASNLLVNAIKYTPDGGKILMSVYKENGQGVLEVRDTGIGIQADHLERIFDRFYQVDGSRYHTSDHDGAGLGLSIVKWIVDAHGGKIEVKSQLEKGTTFRVLFPLVSQTMQVIASHHTKSVPAMVQHIYERKN